MKTKRNAARQIAAPVMIVWAAVLLAASFFALHLPNATDPNSEIVLDPGNIPLAPSPEPGNLWAVGVCLLIVIGSVFALAFLFPSCAGKRQK